MEKPFLALWADNSDQNSDHYREISVNVRETQLSELSPGNVLIRAEYSGLNYKDALAVGGAGKILRNLPLIPGIDVAGEVMESKSAKFKAGDKVLINGCNLGEKLTGGFSQVVRAQEDTIIPLPEGLSTREAMIFGTAGFTAALAIHQLEINGASPERGPVLVTGATGGVGSCAVSFLNKKGYEVDALTRKTDRKEWLEQCGANRVIQIDDFSTKPLESVVWSAAIDNLGGAALEYILPRIELWGSVASIGLAKQHTLNTTVYPFILRGVNLLGISSNNCPQKLRESLWLKIAHELKPYNLETLVYKTIGLQEIQDTCNEVLNSEHSGRILVEL